MRDELVPSEPVLLLPDAELDVEQRRAGQRDLVSGTLEVTIDEDKDGEARGHWLEGLQVDGEAARARRQEDVGAHEAVAVGWAELLEGEVGGAAVYRAGQGV